MNTTWRRRDEDKLYFTIFMTYVDVNNIKKNIESFPTVYFELKQVGTIQYDFSPNQCVELHVSCILHALTLLCLLDFQVMQGVCIITPDL